MSPKNLALVVLALTSLFGITSAVLIESGTAAVVNVTSGSVTREVRLIAAILTSNCSKFDTAVTSYIKRTDLAYDSFSHCWCWYDPLSTGTWTPRTIVDGQSVCDCEMNPETTTADGEVVLATGMYLCDNGMGAVSPELCNDMLEFSYGMNADGMWYKTQEHCVPNVPQVPYQTTCGEVKNAYLEAQCCGGAANTSHTLFPNTTTSGGY